MSAAPVLLAAALAEKDVLISETGCCARSQLLRAVQAAHPGASPADVEVAVDAVFRVARSSEDLGALLAELRRREAAP